MKTYWARIAIAALIAVWAAPLAAADDLLGGLVHHTDGEREWAYDRTSSVGRLDKGLDEAKANNWILASMKDDWKHIFAFEGK